MDSKPSLQSTDVAALCELFGVKVNRFLQLNGYDDLNFWIKDFEIIDGKYKGPKNKDGYVLKVINSEESKDVSFYEGQTELLLQLGRRKCRAPQPVSCEQGKKFILRDLKGNGKIHVVILLTFIPGKLIKDISVTSEMAYNLGKFLFHLDESMKGAENEGLKKHYSMWQLINTLQSRSYLHVIREEEQRAKVEGILDNFEQKVLSRIDTFEKGIIHGDFNEQNVLYDDTTGEFGILDFGDCHYGPYVFEVAIGLCYILLLTGTLDTAKHFLAGYAQIKPFSDDELDIIKICVEARLCQSLVLGLHAYSLDPNNKYVLSTQEAGWKLFNILHSFCGTLL